MPIYAYRCKRGHEFDYELPRDKAGARLKCACGSLAEQRYIFHVGGNSHHEEEIPSRLPATPHGAAVRIDGTHGSPTGIISATIRNCPVGFALEGNTDGMELFGRVRDAPVGIYADNADANVNTFETIG